MLKKLTYYGHSCFRIEAENGWTAVIDPYAPGSVPGLCLPDLTADEVFCSHEHADHNAAGEVRRSGSNIRSPYRAKTILTDHDDQDGALRGKNRVLILTCGDEKIVHLGDLGCIPAYDVLAPMKNADILMVPCGGYYTIDAAEAGRLIDLLTPKLTILMHYRSEIGGYDVLASIEDIQRIMPAAVMIKGDSVTKGQYEGIICLEPNSEACVKESAGR